MRPVQNMLLAASSFGLVIAAAGCSDQPVATAPVGTDFAALTVASSGTPVTVAVGDTVRFTSELSNTGSVDWTVRNRAVLKDIKGPHALAIAEGRTYVVATGISSGNLGRKDSVLVTVATEGATAPTDPTPTAPEDTEPATAPSVVTASAGTAVTVAVSDTVAFTSRINGRVEWTVRNRAVLKDIKGANALAIAEGATYVVVSGATSANRGQLDSVHVTVRARGTTPPADTGTADPQPAPAPAPVASIVISLGTSSLTVGQTTTATASLLDADGTPLTDRAVTWRSSNTGVASITAQGVVTAVAAGSASVTATSEGISKSATVTVTAPTSPTTGVVILPGQSIQAAVDKYPAGTRFVLKAGTYNNQRVVPKSGNAFIGEPGAVLKGNGTTVYAFEHGSVKPYPSNVRIEGLEITGYNPPLHYAPIRAGGGSRSDATTGWVIERNHIHHNSYGGVRVGNKTQVLNNKLVYNGMLGLMGAGDSVLVEGNEIANNNVAAPGVTTVSASWGGGGMKLVGTRWAVIRGNFVHHNGGSGLWTDINNIHTLYENNRVEDNTHAGIFHEISYDAVIRNNQVARNGHNSQGWIHGSGILVAESPNVEVYGNTLTDNATGIMGKQQVRNEGAEYGPHVLENLWVHDNTIVLTTVRSGVMNLVSGIGSDVADKESYWTTRGNRFDRNNYRLPSSFSKPFFWQGGAKSDSEWRNYGQDRNGTISR